MALKIRLARGGSKKRPFYRVVVAEATAPRDGRFIEKLGTYNPLLPRESKERVKLNIERIQYWLSVGSLPTDRVARFLGEAKIIDMPKISDKPKKSQPKAKAQERLKEKKEEEAAKIAAKKEAKISAEAPTPVEEEALEKITEEVTVETSNEAEKPAL